MQASSNHEIIDIIRDRMFDYGLSNHVQTVLCNLILEGLHNAYSRGQESIRQSSDYKPTEDMGR